MSLSLSVKRIEETCIAGSTVVGSFIIDAQEGKRNITPECARAWSTFSEPISSYISGPKQAANTLSAAFTAYLNGSSPDANEMHKGLNSVIKQIGECMDQCERSWLQYAESSDAQGGFIAAMVNQKLDDDGVSLRR